MSRLLGIAAIAFATVAVASPSHACTAIVLPSDKLAYAYKIGSITSVAIVRIVKAQFIAKPSGDAHPWQAYGVVEQTLRGSVSSKIVRFKRGLGSGACDDGRPPPKIGERWVVYYSRYSPREEPIWQSYPAKMAFEIDPQLRSRRS